MVDGAFFTGFGELLITGGKDGRLPLDSVLCLFAGRSHTEPESAFSRLLYVLVTRFPAPWETVSIVVLGAVSVSSDLHFLGQCLASSCGFLLRCVSSAFAMAW